ncbi:transporter [Anditalea andensis]|uniref:Transporter n=2 Tax=Anditalea andensis TaxID=1048983 RepID=A0A074KW10_9BACT|nr:transporter [Anditalea andensis]
MFLFGMGHLYAQNPNRPDSDRVMDLDKVVQTALANNISIKQKFLDEKSAQHQRKEIVGSGLPQLRGYGNYNNFIDIFPQAIPGGLFDPTQDPNTISVLNFGVPQSIKAGLEVTQLIYSHSYIVGLKAAKTSQEYYYLLSRQNEEDVIYDVVLNFYNVKAAELQADNLRSNLERLNRLNAIVKSQVENDLARKVDLNRIKVNMTTLETQLDNIEIGIEQGLNYLKLLMGVPMDTPLVLEAIDFDMDHASENIDHNYTDIYGRADFKVLDKVTELQNLDIRNIRSGYVPTLAAFFDLNYNAFSTEFDFLNRSHNWYRGALFGLQLNVPIFDGFQRKHKISQAKISADKLSMDRQNLNEAAMAEYLTATKKLENSFRGLNAQKENLKLSEEVMYQSEQLYKEGLAPLTDLLDAELALREARSSFYNQTVNVKTAQADLLKSTGRIKEISK